MDAVIYARVSRDRGKKARSVEEQIAECQQECARRGWQVIEVIADNDIGASQHTAKKDRPGYRELKAALPSASVLVAWESSRVTRNPWELEELLPVCAEYGVLLCYSGSIYDPSKPSDKLMLRVTGATNAHEVDLTRERVLRNVRHRVAEGRPHGRMPYGYRREFDPKTGEVVNWVPDPETAPVIREAAARLLSGDTLYAVCKDFQERGVEPPSRGGKQPQAYRWVPSRLRVMILSPTYAGLRSHKGEVTGKGTWEPLITEDEHLRLVSMLKDPKRVTTFRGSEPRHLLTGIATCGRCGPDNPKARIRWFGPSSVKTPRYECENCYLGRRADKVDELVEETMISFLEDPRTIKLLSESDDSVAGEAMAQAQAARQRLEALRDEYVDEKVSAASFAAIEAKLLAKIEKAEEVAKSAASNPLLASLAGPNAREAWKGLDITTKRTAIDMTLKIAILYQPPMGRRFDPNCIDLSWKI